MHERKHVGRPRLPDSEKRDEKVGVTYNAEEAKILDDYRRKHLIGSKADCIRVAALREARRDLGLDTR